MGPGGWRASLSAGLWGKVCRVPAPAGSRGTLGERETHRTALDRAKSARERERKKERDQTRNMQQSLAVALFFTITFIP